jgi:hypothetical protein
MSKVEVIEQLCAIYEPVQSLATELTSVQLEMELAPGIWTIKDVIAHLAFWDQNFSNLLRWALKREPREELTGTVDEINARVYAEYHHWSVPQVFEFLNQTLQKLIAMIELISQEDLTAPGRFDIGAGRPFGEYVIHEIEGHFRDHADQLRQLREYVTEQAQN